MEARNGRKAECRLPYRKAEGLTGKCEIVSISPGLCEVEDLSRKASKVGTGERRLAPRAEVTDRKCADVQKPVQQREILCTNWYSD